MMIAKAMVLALLACEKENDQAHSSIVLQTDEAQRSICHSIFCTTNLRRVI